MVRNYETQPIFVEATQYTGTNFSEIEAFLKSHQEENTELHVKVTEVLNANVDDLNLRYNTCNYEITKFDRFLKITFDKKKTLSLPVTLSLFKNDYLAWSDADNKFLVYTSTSFNKLFQLSK